MLRDSDLQAFVALVQRAERDASPPTGVRPDSKLRAERKSNDLLHQNEYGRLERSLRIACAAGDVSDSPHRILHAIVQDFSSEDFCYLPLTHSAQWLDAIQWAISNPQPLVSDYRGQDRQFVAGTACQVLRRQGYQVHIGAHGPRVDAPARTEIARHIDSLIAQMGGIYAAHQLFRIIHETGKVHAGIWLFGNFPARIDQPPEPAVPLGWLLSIALRHIHVKPSTDDPADAWNTAVRLAIAFAASMDCQRYNRFDGLYLAAPDFLPALEESLTWRELFTLPQVPPSVVPTIRHAFTEILWPPGTDELRAEVDQLFRELDHLLTRLSVARLSWIPQSSRSDYPLIWNYARAPQEGVNTEYLDPFGRRNHDRFVFFEAVDDHVVALPPAMTAAAGCKAIFRLVWDKAGKRAGDIVGDTIEKSVAIACRTHAECVSEKVTYHAGGAKLEIDVAVRAGQEIVLFETKAKSLTSVSRTGDMIAFIEDYTMSFMALFGQLVRHEHNIKLGLTPLNLADEDSGALHVTKVAISPLCYGPASDHVLAGSLVRSIAGARFSSVDGNEKHCDILDALNDRVDQIMNDIEQVAPRRGGQIDLFRYMLHVFWLDLGQLVYALQRGRSLVDGLSALRNLTFGTQDFWTEAALADRQSLTDSKWHPASGRAADT